MLEGLENEAQEARTIWCQALVLTYFGTARGNVDFDFYPLHTLLVTTSDSTLERTAPLRPGLMMVRVCWIMVVPAARRFTACFLTLPRGDVRPGCR